MRELRNENFPFFPDFSLIPVKRQQRPGRKAEVGQRCGVEYGAWRYRESATYGSGQEQCRKGFRVSIAVIVRSRRIPSGFLIPAFSFRLI